MIRSLSEPTPPTNLTEYFRFYLDRSNLAIRRRSVLTQSEQGGIWTLLMSVVQAFPDPAQRPCTAQKQMYEHVVLLEDWLEPSDVQEFLIQIQSGALKLGEAQLERKANPTWQTEFVSSTNPYMDRVGLVVWTKFEGRPIAISQAPLISTTEPYYPDTASAAREWLGLAQYHDLSDSRNGHIIFLLPEARAFFSRAISDDGTLRLMLAGSDIGRIQLIVKGAYQKGRKLRHFEKRVIGDQVDLQVPNEVDRLEYVLLDDAGRLYDIQREAGSVRSGLIRTRARATDHALVQQVLDARESGEGDQIEFKPFVDPGEGSGHRRASAKFREILRTVAAFANTRGGSIFFGISDDCAVKGIQDDLSNWGDSSIGDELCSRYKGTLTNKIKGELVGDVRFRLSFTAVDGATIAILNVSPFEKAPVGLKDEGLCYVRRGANNRYLSPHEWLVTFAATSYTAQ